MHLQAVPDILNSKAGRPGGEAPERPSITNVT
jgi:hypothetical protein